MTNDSKAIAKSFSIQTQQAVYIQELGEKFSMNDSEIVQMAIEVLKKVDEKNLMMHLMKMVMDKS